MYGEIFTAALQSAAFAESDREKLIDIGLSYIPEDCAVARAIRKTVECYHNGIDYLEARKIVHNTAPGTFGIQEYKLSEIPKENNEGMEIESLALMHQKTLPLQYLVFYGEGDFGKSLIIANNCGEDTDCTCATLGALLGIIYGASGLPEKWTKPLDDKIVTMCIDKTSHGIWVPDTATELAERILRVVPGFLGQDLCDALQRAE